MLSYLIVLMCFVALCTFWAAFQIWLDKYRTPEQRAAQDGCQACDEPCGKEALSQSSN
jgi:hypothetical protein